jgi:hypothetical protein
MPVRKTKKGADLKRWFKEEWVDVRSGKPCGRQEGEKRGTPYCRPSKRVSERTPVTADDKRERSEERPIADHQNVSAKEPLLLHPRLLPHKRKNG